MRSKYEKYVEKIHDIYLEKAQYIIDVLNSCVTENQVNACRNWAANIFKQWYKYEERIIDNTHGGWVAFKLTLELHKEMKRLKNMCNLSSDRKIAKLSEKEEF